MAKTVCSLCGKTKVARLLDMDDLPFKFYVLLRRKIGWSRYKGQLGVCSGCMKEYERMNSNYHRKRILYYILALIFAVLYLSFTQNLLASLLLALFIVFLSLLSYCPPLKD